MDTTILRQAGLTESQAKGYLALIEYGSLTPTELAEKTGESRTNGYAIADKLVAVGLATKKDDSKKAVYTASHPSALESLAEKRRKVVMRNEQAVKQGISPLIDLFYRHSELPGARTLQGIDGIKEVYSDTLREMTDIYLWRTTADAPLLGNDYYNEYRKQRAEAGIATYAITPDAMISRHHVKNNEDSLYNYHRTFIPANGYTAAVEIDVYGDKVAMIAFGETQMAIIITSPLIAEGLRQIIKLTATAYKDYSDELMDEIT